MKSLSKSLLFSFGLLVGCSAHVGCGVQTEILEPNTVQVCQKAIDCGIFPSDSLKRCDLCLSIYADKFNEQAVAKAIDDAMRMSCEQLKELNDGAGVKACVEGGR